jgi:hypothetical protein
MPIDIEIALAIFALLVIGSLGYAVFRLWRDPRPQNLPMRSQRFARFMLFPRFFDPLLAKPLTRREKLGWLLFLLIAVLAVVFTGGK